MLIGRGTVVALAAALVGCAAPPAAPPSRTAGDGEGADGAAAALAEQARRDVQALRGLAEAAESDAAREPAGPAEIQWTRLPGPAPRRPDGADGDATAGQAALGRDRASGLRRQSQPQPQPEVPGGALAAAEDSALPEETDAGTEKGAEAASPDADRLRELIVELSAELYREAAYSDMPLRELLLIAATTLVTPDRALATEALPGLTGRERELLSRLQEHFAKLGEKLAADGDPEAVVREVAALHLALTHRPRLELPRAALCTRVGGFGDYDEFPRNEAGRYAFLAHSGRQAVVYVEVENFTSELNDDGQWVTELSQRLVVYSDRDGIPVWREDWQAGVDVSRNRREDFFIVQVITLPDRLSVGRYDLKIHIRDEKSGAEAETAVEFEMVADARLAPR